MANFDSTRWYQIYLKQDTVNSLDGTYLYEAGHGAVFMRTTNITIVEEKWQIFPYNSSYYVLRTQASGPSGFLTVQANVNETTLGSTVPIMSNATITDASMFWQVSPWGDGTFFLANAANGSAWHLNAKSNGLMAMSSNITAPQNGQTWTFNATGTIEDTRFQSLPAATTNTAKTTPSGNSTTTTTTASSSSAASSSGLSTGAKAGIGAAVGVVALIALAILGFVLLRRRKRGAYAQAQSTPPDYSTDGAGKYGLAEIGGSPKMTQFRDQKVELPNDTRVPELGVHSEPMELPAEPYHHP